jgi:zinc/manganese transport system substrate-binding protein
LIAGARNADMLFCTGAELEIGWLPLLLRQSGNAKIQLGQPGHFMAAEKVQRIDIPEVLDRSMGDIHASGNPHVHLDPYRLLEIAEQFSLRLQQINQDNKSVYQENFNLFSRQWKQAIVAWEEKSTGLKGRKVVIQHGHTNYLLRWLGIEIVADLEPRPGLPPSSTHLAHLLTLVREEPPDFILITMYQNTKGAEWLSIRSKVPVVILPFTVGGSDKANDLFSLYDDTIERLLAALK